MNTLASTDFANSLIVLLTRPSASFTVAGLSAPSSDKSATSDRKFLTEIKRAREVNYIDNYHELLYENLVLLANPEI